MLLSAAAPEGSQNPDRPIDASPPRIYEYFFLAFLQISSLYIDILYKKKLKM